MIRFFRALIELEANTLKAKTENLNCKFLTFWLSGVIAPADYRKLILIKACDGSISVSE